MRYYFFQKTFLGVTTVTKLLPLIAALVLTSTASFAQAAPAGTKIGVINIQGAIVSTKEGQKAAQAMQEKFGPRQKEFEAKQAEIEALRADLAKGSNTMAEARRNDISRQIDTKTRDLNRATEDAQAEVEAEQNKILNELGGKVMEVVNQYGKDNGYMLILDANSQGSSVLFASNDITKEIIDLYDKATASAPATPAAKPAATTPRPPAAPKTPAAK
jgi:outer membrane protein